MEEILTERKVLFGRTVSEGGAARFTSEWVRKPGMLADVACCVVIICFLHQIPDPIVSTRFPKHHHGLETLQFQAAAAPMLVPLRCSPLGVFARGRLANPSLPPPPCLPGFVAPRNLTEPFNTLRRQPWRAGIHSTASGTRWLHR